MELDNITQYRSLGWDFDMTLHGHPQSQKFWDYIYENPHCQTHHIVTFRTGRLLDRIWRDPQQSSRHVVGLVRRRHRQQAMGNLQRDIC
jgi:hypothetical protein